MADNKGDSRPGDSRTIQEIVRAVVANLGALPNSAGLPPRATLSGLSASTVVVIVGTEGIKGCRRRYCSRLLFSRFDGQAIV